MCITVPYTSWERLWNSQSKVITMRYVAAYLLAVLGSNDGTMIHMNIIRYTVCSTTEIPILTHLLCYIVRLHTQWRWSTCQNATGSVLLIRAFRMIIICQFELRQVKFVFVQLHRIIVFPLQHYRSHVIRIYTRMMFYTVPDNIITDLQKIIFYAFVQLC